MRKRWVGLMAVVVILGAMGGVSTAHADAAPPQGPPGASIENGGKTMVQMMSERVDITVGTNEGTNWKNYEGGEHVEAYFYMLNQGDKAETMDVRFPLRGIEARGYYEWPTENFKVWVDHTLVETKEVMQPAPEPNKDDRMLPWATWPMTFEPGQLTAIHVSYEQWGSFFYPYEYILQTGAGWYGPIRSGTVVVHYPFELNSLNISAGGREGMTFEMSGSNLIWTFSDLEPTPKSDITFEAMAPAQWGDIIAARHRIDVEPGSVDAHFGLAKALQNGLWLKYELIRKFNSDALVDLTIEAYEQTLLIEPRNEDIWLEYLRFVDNIKFFMEPPDPRLPPLVERALAVYPNNPHFRAMQTDIRQRYEQATKNAILALTPSATPTITLTPTATVPTREPYFTRTPSPGPTTAEQSTLTPAPMPTVTATPMAAPGGSANFQEWTTFVLPGVIAVIIIATWLRRRRRAGEPAQPAERHKDGPD